MARNESLCIVEAVVRYQQQMGVSMSVTSSHRNVFQGKQRPMTSTKVVIE